MESIIYKLHPVFEFFLTSYFALLAAPKFLSEFLVEKVPVFSKQSKERLISVLLSLSNQIRHLESIPQKINDEPTKSQILALQTNLLDPFKAQIVETRSEIDILDDDTIKRKLITETQSLYYGALVFSGFYNLSILLLNGCHWFEAFSFPAYCSLLMLEIFSIFVLILLINRRKINLWVFVGKSQFARFISSTPFHFIYSFIFCFLCILLAFYLIPQNYFYMKYSYELCEKFPSEIKLASITLLIITAGLPLALYSFHLSRCSTQVHRIFFNDRIESFREQFLYIRTRYQEMIAKLIAPGS